MANNKPNELDSGEELPDSGIDAVSSGTEKIEEQEKAVRVKLRQLFAEKRERKIDEREIQEVKRQEGKKLSQEKFEEIFQDEKDISLPDANQVTREYLESNEGQKFLRKLREGKAWMFITTKKGDKVKVLLSVIDKEQMTAEQQLAALEEGNLSGDLVLQGTVIGGLGTVGEQGKKYTITIKKEKLKARKWKKGEAKEGEAEKLTVDVLQKNTEYVVRGINGHLMKLIYEGRSEDTEDGNQHLFEQREGDEEYLVGILIPDNEMLISHDKEGKIGIQFLPTVSKPTKQRVKPPSAKGKPAAKKPLDDGEDDAEGGEDDAEGGEDDAEGGEDDAEGGEDDAEGGEDDAEGGEDDEKDEAGEGKKKSRKKKPRKGAEREDDDNDGLVKIPDFSGRDFSEDGLPKTRKELDAIKGKDIKVRLPVGIKLWRFFTKPVVVGKCAVEYDEKRGKAVITIANGIVPKTETHGKAYGAPMTLTVKLESDEEEDETEEEAPKKTAKKKRARTKGQKDRAEDENEDDEGKENLEEGETVPWPKNCPYLEDIEPKTLKNLRETIKKTEGNVHWNDKKIRHCESIKLMKKTTKDGEIFFIRMKFDKEIVRKKKFLGFLRKAEGIQQSIDKQYDIPCDNKGNPLEESEGNPDENEDAEAPEEAANAPTADFEEGAKELGTTSAADLNDKHVGCKRGGFIGLGKSRVVGKIESSNVKDEEGKRTIVLTDCVVVDKKGKVSGKYEKPVVITIAIPRPKRKVATEGEDAEAPAQDVPWANAPGRRKKEAGADLAHVEWAEGLPDEWNNEIQTISRLYPQKECRSIVARLAVKVARDETPEHTDAKKTLKENLGTETGGWAKELLQAIETEERKIRGEKDQKAAEILSSTPDVDLIKNPREIFRAEQGHKVRARDGNRQIIGKCLTSEDRGSRHVITVEIYAELNEDGSFKNATKKKIITIEEPYPAREPNSVIDKEQAEAENPLFEKIRNKFPGGQIVFLGARGTTECDVPNNKIRLIIGQDIQEFTPEKFDNECGRSKQEIFYPDPALEKVDFDLTTNLTLEDSIDQHIGERVKIRDEGVIIIGTLTSVSNGSLQLQRCIQLDETGDPIRYMGTWKTKEETPPKAPENVEKGPSDEQIRDAEEVTIPIAIDTLRTLQGKDIKYRIETTTFFGRVPEDIDVLAKESGTNGNYAPVLIKVWRIEEDGRRNYQGVTQLEINRTPKVALRKNAEDAWILTGGTITEDMLKQITSGEKIVIQKKTGKDTFEEETVTFLEYQWNGPYDYRIKVKFSDGQEIWKKTKDLNRG